jgi:hypothetical protein
MVQVALFLCALSVANDLQMQQWLQQNWNIIELQITATWLVNMLIILNDYWNLKINRVKVLLVKSQWKGSRNELFSSRTYCPENEKLYS